MYFRLIYDEILAQAAYLIGCQKSGEAILVDPQRDIERYKKIAKAHSLRIVGVTETHIHADFVSGSREAATQWGATAYLSAAGGDDWSYRWPTASDSIDVVKLAHGQRFSIGNIEFTVLHTPGHTPEHVSFLVTDKGSDADEPIGMLTGDHLFVGDVGRPDLLETAAGMQGTQEQSAEALYESIKQLDELPEFLQIWPGHGSGSACGKALGAVPQSTLGYERRFNPALRAHKQSKEAFLEYVLSGQPEPPLYFARMKSVNRDGPDLLGELPKPGAIELAEIDTKSMDTLQVLDLRSWDEYRSAHLPGAIWSVGGSILPAVVGSFFDPERALLLVAEPWQVERVVLSLVRIGYDRIESFVTPATMEQLAQRGGMSSIQEVSPADVDENVTVLDVRRATEFAHGHIEGALNISHTRLRTRLDELPRDKPLVVHCQSGVRSGASCGLLAAEGFDVRNLAGGIVGWAAAGRPTVVPSQLV